MLCGLSSWADLQYPLAQEAASLQTPWIIGAKKKALDMMQWVFMAHSVFLLATIGLSVTCFAAAMEADKVGAWWAVEIWDLRQVRAQKSQQSGLHDLSLVTGTARSSKALSALKLPLVKRRPWGVYEWLGDRHCSIMLNLSKQTWHTWIYVAENPHATGSNRVLTWAGSHPGN